MPNSPALERLLALHRIDADIDKLKRQKELLPVSLRRVEARLAQQRQALDDRKEQAKTLRVASHSKETQLRAAEEDIEGLGRKLNSATTNKEYAAVQHEIIAKRTDASRIEDEVLAAMADTEALEAQARELEQNIAQIEREHSAEAGEVDKQASSVDEQVAGLQARREGAANAVDGELLREYERIAAKKGSSAVAAVAANTCQGCFMQLPPQLVHTLAAGREIVHCPSCSRILYSP